MSHGRFLGALVLAVVSNSWASSTLWAANGCESSFRKAAELPPTSIRATSDTMEKGQVMVSGFTIVTARTHLSAVLADAPEGERVINRINVEPQFYIGEISRLSETEVVVEYRRDPHYYDKIAEASSVQVLRVEADGRFVPVQKFDGTETNRISFRDTIGENGLVLETRGRLNSGSSVQVFRREPGGKFQLASKLDRTEYSELGPSVSDPNSYFVVSRFSHFHSQDSLLRFVPGTKKPQLVLEGGKKDTPAGILVNQNPKRIFRLTGDYFGRGFTGSSSRHLKDIEVFKVTAEGKAKKVGDIPIEKRNTHRGFYRTAESVDPNTLAVLDSHSYTTGVIGNNTQFAWHHRDLDLNIVRFHDGKMSMQTINIKNEAKFGSKDAIALELQPLSPTEILLTGQNYVQVVRAPRKKFEEAEVVRFEGFKEEPLRGDRMEVVRISPTRFIIQDQFVYERLPDDYRSQFHVFDLIDGKYRLTDSKLLDGRRMFSTTVLTNGQIMVDVRPFADRETPRLQILDLGLQAK